MINYPFKILYRILLLNKTINSSKRLLKQLGYPERTKLLIIHADDLGLSSSENIASIKAIKIGVVNSGSIMATCPKFHEMVDISKTHPEIDLGIHLTLTSEWESYKWGPVLPSSEVASLVDSDGYFFKEIITLLKNIKYEDVEKELLAQINRILESGIDLTHIDTHMMTAFSDSKMQNIYIKLGKKFKLPVLLNEKMSIHNFDILKEFMINHLYYAQPENYRIGLDIFYRDVINSVKPGLNCILVHTAYDDEEMQNVTQDTINHGSKWRQKDFDFFTSNECKELINNSNIQMITWREIRDKLFR